MTNMTNTPDFTRSHEVMLALKKNFSSVVIGQHQAIDELLMCVAAGGHILIEGVPGLAKTLLARALAQSTQAEHVRIQFTPDLMPSDIVGHAMFEQQTNRFTIRQGPVFSNIVIADEINRAPAKTQSALLEAMQEQQVSLEGETRRLPNPFIVVATQNPIEQEGTYPLPQAQLDRFLCKTLMDYPNADDEKEMLNLVTHEQVANQFSLTSLEPVASIDDVTALQTATSFVAVDDAVQRYIVELVQSTRQWNGIDIGAGPRASIALLRAARGQAMLEGQTYATPDHVKRVAPAILRHRIQLTPDLDIEGYKADDMINTLLNDVSAPRQ